MRQIVLDTETTGMPVKDGHRIIEIGCVEMIDRRLTGNNYHQYINPQREVDLGAFQVHGISDDFLSDKPIIENCIDEFLDYVSGAELIIHNAQFDVGFLDNELALVGRNLTINECCSVIDTLQLARKKHPGSRVNLDALTKRYGITNFNREYHGALLDSEILARVYLAMTGGQEGLSFFDSKVIPVDSLSADKPNHKSTLNVAANKSCYSIEKIKMTDEELALHRSFFERIKN